MPYDSASTIEVEIVQSSFVYQGSFQVTKNHINQNGRVTMSLVPGTQLYGMAFFKVDTKDAKSLSRMSGFVTISHPLPNNYPLYWDRRWCRFDGTALNLYYYPKHDGVEEPMDVIDLKMHDSCFIEVANRLYCPKPRCLMLETADFIGEKKEVMFTRKYFFHFDNLEEMEMWKLSIRETIKAMKTWKVHQMYDSVV